VLSVRWPEDLSDGYDNDRLAPRVRASAAETARLLRAQGLRTWVQPVVVLWGTFDRVSLQSGKVAWVRGKDLARVLSDRPVTFPAENVAHAAIILRSTPNSTTATTRTSLAA
jgi:hypothetical protein